MKRSFTSDGMKRWGLLAAMILFMPLTAKAQVPWTILREDFEKLELGSNVDEPEIGEEVWTASPPDDWTIDNSGLPAGGITEWRGWSFANKEWWTAAAGDQDRSQFVNASGTVMIADPDEWDDTANEGGVNGDWYDTFITTHTIEMSIVEPETAVLRFDSSWRDEFDSSYQQSGNITVSYDGGEPIEILRWLSDPDSPDFKDDAQNETIEIPLNNPEGAQTMEITWGMFDAGNDWWWAIDNIAVDADVTGLGDFNSDGVVDSVDFETLRSNFRQGRVSYSDGDINFDRFIDLNDFAAFIGFFNAEQGGAAAAVPEPGSMLLMGLGVTCLFWLQRRQRRS